MKYSVYYSDEEVFGSITFDAKHDMKYYKKYGMDLGEANYAGYECALHHLRYIDWSDRAGFVPSKNSMLAALGHKAYQSWTYEEGFDHTTFWRKPGDRWPSFCLTEPYARVSPIEFLKVKEKYKKYASPFEYKFFHPSSKSIWFPKQLRWSFGGAQNFSTLKSMKRF